MYDQSSSDTATVSAESFLGVLLLKLAQSFPSVHLLSGEWAPPPGGAGLQSDHHMTFLCTSSGGFSRFCSLFPGLCEGKSPPPPSGSPQPGPPATTSGPTRILPHLYLGCQRDVLDQVRRAPLDGGVSVERDCVSL